MGYSCDFDRWMKICEDIEVLEKERAELEKGFLDTFAAAIAKKWNREDHLRGIRSHIEMSPGLAVPGHHSDYFKKRTGMLVCINYLDGDYNPDDYWMVDGFGLAKGELTDLDLKSKQDYEDEERAKDKKREELELYKKLQKKYGGKE